MFGRPFWDDLAAHPRIAADFDALMGPAGHGVPDYDIELSGGWEPIRTIVDVGGGTGALLASLLRRHPQVRGILVDLPGTVARAGQIMAEAGVAGRVTMAGQSFFDPLPAGADLYLLKSVLNDWPDEPTVAILRRCAQAARPGSSIAVLGGVSADEAPRCPGYRHAGGGRQDQHAGAVHRAGPPGRPRCPRGRPPVVRPVRGRVPPRAATGRESHMSQDSETSRALSLEHGQVCYLQLPAVRSARAAAFYAAVFGWEIEEHAPDFVAPGLIGQWVEDRPPARTPARCSGSTSPTWTRPSSRSPATAARSPNPPTPDGPDRTLATILDPEGNPVGLAAHTR